MAVSNSNSSKQSPPISGSKTYAVWWWVAGLLLLGVPFLLRPGGDAEEDALDARRQKIENMSASERERLERNFERFQKLPPERQEVLREIELAVSEDETLNKTLLAYERWLSTLSPWERLDLRNAESVEDRLQYVSAINTARRQEADDYRQRESQWQELVKQNLSNFQGPERKPEHARLSDNELSNMMTVLETHSPQVKLTKTSLPGCAAYNIQLLAEALKSTIQQITLEKAREKPLSDETAQKMIDQITESKAQLQVQELFDKSGCKGFVSYLAWKLEMAWWNEAREHPPSQAELDRVAETLGGKVLEDFLKRKESDPRRAYFHLLMATRPATFHTDTKELNDVLEKLELRRSRYRPNGSGRPTEGGRFGGDRRGDRSREDDDRDREENDDRKGKDDEKFQRGE